MLSPDIGVLVVPTITLSPEEMRRIRDGRVNDDTTSYIFEPEEIARRDQLKAEEATSGDSS